MTPAQKLAGMIAGSAALAALPASVAAVPETEPNDPIGSAQAATVGTSYTGTVCTPSSLCDPPSSFGGLDPIDFYHYTGLPAGNSFDFSLDPTIFLFDTDQLRAGLYASDGTLLDSVLSTGAGGAGGPLVHLTGVIPGSGELFFGIDSPPGDSGFEGYIASLEVTSRVPAPAPLALLGAGLTALGLEVARRRKRG